jgi:transmembrane sensor
MSRAREAGDRAAQWILAGEEGGWTESDQADLQTWLAESDGNKAAYWRLKHSWREADRIAALGRRHMPDGDDLGEPESRDPRLRRWLPASIAAAIIVAAGVGYNLFAPPREAKTAVATKQFDTAIGVRKVIDLGDGSKVELNTSSRARVALGEKGRELWLDSGEAYFDVAHRDGLPFIVHAGNRQVTVLGTKFSVRRIGAEVAISVLEGRVRVDEVDGKRSLRSTIIAGGDIARTSGPTTLVIARSEQRVENMLAWREGMLNFDRTRLADAAAEFNRYNRKPILVTDAEVGDMRIGGMFPATDPDAFVRLLRDAYDLKVEDTPDSVKVSN